MLNKMMKIREILEKPIRMITSRTNDSSKSQASSVSDITPLMSAAANGDLSTVEKLVQQDQVNVFLS
jgi:hypothetical protein